MEEQKELLAKASQKINTIEALEKMMQQEEPEECVYLQSKISKAVKEFNFILSKIDYL